MFHISFFWGCKRFIHSRCDIHCWGCFQRWILVQTKCLKIQSGVWEAFRGIWEHIMLCSQGQAHVLSRNDKFTWVVYHGFAINMRWEWQKREEKRTEARIRLSFKVHLIHASVRLLFGDPYTKKHIIISKLDESRGSPSENHHFWSNASSVWSAVVKKSININLASYANWWLITCDDVRFTGICHIRHRLEIRHRCG